MKPAQTPLGTAFGPFTTAEEVAGDIDLSGRVAIVTGGVSNLGRETVRVLASRGARVIVPARDIDAARKALSGIPRMDVMHMDLLDPDSVRRFAGEFLAAHKALDLLILSAGVMATPLFRDADGHEGQFATNHLGHFRLTAALWPALRAAGGARVVVLSSRGHQIGGFDLADLDFNRRPYDKWLAYGQGTPEQLRELTDARKAFEEVRPHGWRDVEAAYEKNPELVQEAADGKLNRTIRALQLETEIRTDPERRADRFVERWQKLDRQRQHQYAQGDYVGYKATRIQMGDMARSLERDPQLESLLAARKKELGISFETGRSLGRELARSHGIDFDRSRGLGI